jgi:hypothetical protein
MDISLNDAKCISCGEISVGPHRTECECTYHVCGLCLIKKHPSKCPQCEKKTNFVFDNKFHSIIRETKEYRERAIRLLKTMATPTFKYIFPEVTCGIYTISDELAVKAALLSSYDQGVDWAIVIRASNVSRDAFFHTSLPSKVLFMNDCGYVVILRPSTENKANK